MSKQLNLLRQNLRVKPLLSISIASIGLLSFSPVAIGQFNNDFQTPVERDLYETSPGERNKNSIFDATNPMELMNILRRATAMDDATSPSDAVDQALSSFDFQEEDDLINSPSELSAP